MPFSTLTMPFGPENRVNEMEVEEQRSLSIFSKKGFSCYRDQRDQEAFFHESFVKLALRKCNISPEHLLPICDNYPKLREYTR